MSILNVKAQQSKHWYKFHINITQLGPEVLELYINTASSNLEIGGHFVGHVLA